MVGGIDENVPGYTSLGDFVGESVYSSLWTQGRGIARAHFYRM